MSESRKRGRGDESMEEGTPKKLVAVEHDYAIKSSPVVVLVDGREFFCVKEELAKHSPVLHKLFTGNFLEKDKTEIRLDEPVDSEGFQLFLDAISGKRTIIDEQVDKALELAGYLASSTFEKSIIEFLASGESKIDLKEQFALAEKYNSQNLLIHVLSEIKDHYTLDEVVPADLDTLSPRTTKMVLQRSFELHGVRRPPPPPLPQGSDQYFEHMMNEFFDQVEVQNRHGVTLADQAFLLVNYAITEKNIGAVSQATRDKFFNDTRTTALMDQLQNAHCQLEKNSIRAQLQVVQLKHLFTCPFRGIATTRIPHVLSYMPAVINRSPRNHLRVHHDQLGDTPIDDIYRECISKTEGRDKVLSREQTCSPRWIRAIESQTKKVKLLNERIEAKLAHVACPPPPPNLRNVTPLANSGILDDFVQNVRVLHYNQIQRRVRDETN